MNLVFLVGTLATFGADFGICTFAAAQQFPNAIYQNGQYYVLWSDNRHVGSEGAYAIYGARVSTSGAVLDPDGKLLFKRQAGYAPFAAYDGTNFLIVFRDSIG